MSEQKRDELKKYFVTGATPTQDQFADLIDSTVNFHDDGLTIDPDGNIGIGVDTPLARLHVGGKLLATTLDGDGAAIMNLNAAQITTGTMDVARLPEIPVAKITGTFAPDQIPMVPASKITGQLKPEQIPSIGPLGPGGRPLIATGTMDTNSTKEIFQIPLPDDKHDNPYYYSYEIYTMLSWYDFLPMPEQNAWERHDYYIMTRTVMAGVVWTYTNTRVWPVQNQTLIPPQTQTNFPSDNFPAISISVIDKKIDDNRRQAWIEMRVSAGRSQYPNQGSGAGPLGPVTYLIYSSL